MRNDSIAQSHLCLPLPSHGSLLCPLPPSRRCSLLCHPISCFHDAVLCSGSWEVLVHALDRLVRMPEELPGELEAWEKKKAKLEVRVEAGGAGCAKVIWRVLFRTVRWEGEAWNSCGYGSEGSSGSHFCLSILRICGTVYLTCSSPVQRHRRRMCG